MTTVNVYLTFNGNCEKAFKLYQSVFGGEFQAFSKFKEMPKGEGMPEMSEEDLEKIMHITLPISKETLLMGSDTAGDPSDSFLEGNNFSISVNTNTREEADRIFKGLSDGGKVTMPMAVTFWQSYFGMLTDKFGINWMVSCEVSK